MANPAAVLTPPHLWESAEEGPAEAGVLGGIKFQELLQNMRRCLQRTLVCRPHLNSHINRDNNRYLIEENQCPGNDGWRGWCNLGVFRTAAAQAPCASPTSSVPAPRGRGGEQMLERRHCGILSAPRGGPRPHLSSCSVPRGPAGPAPILQNRAPWRMDLDGPRRAEEQGPGLAPPGLERRRAARGLECGDPATERGAHAGPSALVSPDPRTGWSWRAPGPGPRACPSRACRPGRNLAPGT